MTFRLIKLFKIFTMTVFIGLLAGQLMNTESSWGAEDIKSKNAVAWETVQIPKDLSSDQIPSFLATLSDTQVRRLLIQELKEEATRELSEGETGEKTGGLAGLIRNIRFIANDIQWRIHYLKSGAGVDPDELPHLYRLLGKNKDRIRREGIARLC